MAIFGDISSNITLGASQFIHRNASDTMFEAIDSVDILSIMPDYLYVDGSLNTKASYTYVDGSLNLKVNQSLFDSSISAITISNVQPWIDINRCGFVDNNETSIGFNDTTYVFSLSRTGSTWSYYRAGIKYTINRDVSVQLPGAPPDVNTYYITLDANDGTITQGIAAWTLTDTVLPVATISWNNANTPKWIMAEERHQVLIDRRIHKYLHETRGTQFIEGGVLSGPTLSGATDASTTFGVSQTVIADEDLYQTLPALTRPLGDVSTYNIYYRTSPTVFTWAPSAVPFRYTSGSYIEWDNNGVMTTGTQVKYYNTYLLFTDQNLTARYSIVHGRQEFASLLLAQAENPLTFDWTGFPVAEGVIAYKFTWVTSNAYTNKGKCRLEAAPVKINISTTAIVGSGSTIDHNTLAGLQGGTTNEYYHLTSAKWNDWAGKTYVDGSIANFATNASVNNAFLTNVSLGLVGTVDTSLDYATYSPRVLNASFYYNADNYIYRTILTNDIGVRDVSYVYDSNNDVSIISINNYGAYSKIIRFQRDSSRNIISMSVQ